jgi:hypothetical protein
MRKTFITLLIVLVAGLMVYGAAGAQQSGGQFCVHAFEDLNGNGQQDGGEPVLMRDISAQLMDSGGLVIDSAMIEKSPNVTRGFLCFQYLPEGQYTLTVSSAEFQPTTLATMVATIGATDVVTLEFGGQRLAEAVETAASSDSTTDDNALIEKMVVAALGTLAVVAAMAVLGGIVYLLVFHRRLQKALPDPRRRTSTGSYPVVQTDTGSYRAVSGDTDSFRPVTGDTGRHRAVSPTDTDEHPKA